MILLSKDALNQKQDGQALLGVLPIVVRRNSFGTQIDSFQVTLHEPAEVVGDDPEHPNGFPALFIRAPVVESVDASVKVLTRLVRGPEEPDQVVAVQCGDILACAFHPELTGDARWHRYFLSMVTHSRQARLATTTA